MLSVRRTIVLSELSFRRVEKCLEYAARIIGTVVLVNDEQQALDASAQNPFGDAWSIAQNWLTWWHYA